MPYRTSYSGHSGHKPYPSKNSGKLEYRKYRVRGHIKSFRDLEIYKKTTELASEIYKIELPKTLSSRAILKQELLLLRSISKLVPKQIAQSYGDRFTNLPLAYNKLEQAMQTISTLIAKIDFMIALIDQAETRRAFVKIIGKYQIQRRKILNLKRAWERIEEKKETQTFQDKPR